MENSRLNFPIVFKPDIGERGMGVFIINNDSQLEDVIRSMNSDYLLQEFIGGEEYGIFYYRYPSDKKGQIFSITKKEYLTIEADGIHNLEELILKDSRAVCLAEIHFDQHIDDLYLIPKKGEIIPLVELGTHSRGAIFYDANDLISVPLSNEIDRISKSFEGFYFGRFDIKVPSTEDLVEGRNIKVIELNGVTSESTNIYDPKHSFFYGTKTLMQQWGIAFEIGSEVKKLNPDLETPTIKHMLSLLR